MIRRWERALPPVAAAALLLAAAGIAPAARAQEAGEPGWLTALRAGKVSKARDLDQHAMGAIPSPASELAKSPRFVVRTARDANRPSSLLLTEYLPPVANQGKQGSCAAWSSCYYCYTYAVSKQRKLPAERLAANERLRFSPAFVYHQGNEGKDSGMPISRAFEILRSSGCASMAEMPYNESDYTSPPSQEAVEHADRYKARNAGLLFKFGGADPEKFKTFLAETQQPVVMGIPIVVDFPMHAVDPDFVYRPTVPLSQQTVRGLHAITCVGYDDAKHAFRIVNSWGPGWGDHGFIWLDEEFVHAYAMDGFAVIAGGLIARDPSGEQHFSKDVSLLPPSATPTVRAR